MHGNCKYGGNIGNANPAFILPVYTRVFENASVLLLSSTL
jgi:hypothetical protein